MLAKGGMYETQYEPQYEHSCHDVKYDYFWLDAIRVHVSFRKQRKNMMVCYGRRIRDGNGSRWRRFSDEATSLLAGRCIRGIRVVWRATCGW